MLFQASKDKLLINDLKLEISELKNKIAKGTEPKDDPKSENEEVQELMSTCMAYLEKIDQLNNENQQLNNENQQLKSKNNRLSSNQSGFGTRQSGLTSLGNLESSEIKKELINVKLELQGTKRDKNRLEKELSEVKRTLIEKENECETLKSELVGVTVLKKTNERLYSELTTLQTQLKKLESMNSSNFSMLNSGLQFNPHNQSKPIPGVPEERTDLELIDQLNKLD